MPSMGERIWVFSRRDFEDLSVALATVALAELLSSAARRAHAPRWPASSSRCATSPVSPVAPRGLHSARSPAGLRGLCDGRLRRRQLRLGLVEGRVQLLRIDLGQDLSFGDAVVEVHRHAGDATGHLGSPLRRC